MSDIDITARAEDLAQEIDRHDRATTGSGWSSVREMIAAHDKAFAFHRSAAPEIATVLRALVAEVRLMRPVVTAAESYVDEYGPLNVADRQRHLLCLAVDAMRAQRGGR